MSANPRLGRFQSLGPHGFHEIAYTEWGDPRSHRLVFCVHGFARNSRDFDALAASLAGTCHVVCMDVAGRGASEWLHHKGDYSFSLYLSDAAALLARITAPLPETRRLRIFRKAPAPPKRQVYWVGTSMGGLIGMMLAAKRHSPIRRLVLNDVGPLVPWSALIRMKQATNGLNKAFSSYKEAEDFLREACAEFGPLSDEQWRHVARHGVNRNRGRSLTLAFDPAIITHMRTGSIKGVAFGSEFMSGLDLWPTYDMIRCPVLVLRGERSDLLPRKIADEMTRRGPKAAIVEFEGIGHAPWLMADDQIAAVRDFLLEGTPAAPGPGTGSTEALLAIPSYL